MYRYTKRKFELAYLSSWKNRSNGKPIIMSTGMGSLGDIELAIQSYNKGLAKSPEIKKCAGIEIR